MGLEQFINRSVDVLPLPFYMFSLCSICICADILKNKVSREQSNVFAFPLCARLQNCRSPSGPERALSSHVPAGGNHRPRLHSRKSTTLGLLRGVGVKRWGAGWTVLPSSYLPFFCLSAQPASVFLSLFTVWEQIFSPSQIFLFSAYLSH